MELHEQPRDVRVSIGFCLLLALGLMLLPLQWVFAVMCAALWHEFCHYVAIRLCGMRPRAWRIGAGGMELEISDLSAMREIICALAGPLGGLMMLTVIHWFPRFSICCAAHGIFNLLPVYPLDGGRVMQCAGRLLFGVGGKRFANTISAVFVLFMLLLGGFAASAWKLGYMALLPGILLGIRSDILKIPCKALHERVQ